MVPALRLLGLEFVCVCGFCLFFNSIFIIFFSAKGDGGEWVDAYLIKVPNFCMGQSFTLCDRNQQQDADRSNSEPPLGAKGALCFSSFDWDEVLGVG